LQEPLQGSCDREIDIMVWLPRNRDEGMAAGCLKYVLSIEKAKQKVAQLIEKVASGEVDYFAVSLREPPKKGKAYR